MYVIIIINFCIIEFLKNSIMPIFIAMDIGKFPQKIFRETRAELKQNIKAVYKQAAEGCLELQDKVGNYDNKDVADAVYYFAVFARNTTGAELVVDGGNTIQLYPQIPDRA